MHVSGSIVSTEHNFSGGLDMAEMTVLENLTSLSIPGFIVYTQYIDEAVGCGQPTNYRRRSGSAALVAALATSAQLPIYMNLAEVAGNIRS